MRHSGTWMTLWDDRILEIIREDGSGSPKELSQHDVVHVSRQHISRRLQKLADHGMLTPLANGVYIITDEGEAYLDGDYDAESGVYLNTSNGDSSTSNNSEYSET